MITPGEAGVKFARARAVTAYATVCQLVLHRLRLADRAGSRRYGPHPSGAAGGTLHTMSRDQHRQPPTDLTLLDGVQLQAGDGPQPWGGFTTAAHHTLARLVAEGAALGWVDPPPRSEVAELLAQVRQEEERGDAALRAAYRNGRLAGLGYWRRYARPTHRPHADLEKLAVDRTVHGRGVGRALTAALVDGARHAGVEVLTLDARGDNTRALELYRSLGFAEYGRLPRFVATGVDRYDKVFCMLDLREQ